MRVSLCLTEWKWSTDFATIMSFLSPRYSTPLYFRYSWVGSSTWYKASFSKDTMSDYVELIPWIRRICYKQWLIRVMIWRMRWTQSCMSAALWKRMVKYKKRIHQHKFDGYCLFESPRPSLTNLPLDLKAPPEFHWWQYSYAGIIFLRWGKLILWSQSS